MKLISSTAAAVLVALAAAVPASAAASPAHRNVTTATLVIAQRTPTGHESDTPVTVTGLGHLRGTWACKVDSGNGTLGPLAHLTCWQTSR